MIDYSLVGRDVCAAETRLTLLLDLPPLYFDLVVDYFLVLLECLMYFVISRASTLHLQFQLFFQCVDLLDEHPPDRLLTLIHSIVGDGLLYLIL